MSLLKFINNKNALHQIRIQKLFDKLLNNTSTLPSYTLLENSPILQQRSITTVETASNNSNNNNNNNEKNYSDIIATELTALEKCITYLFGANIKKKTALTKCQSRELHRNTKNDRQRRPLPRLLYVQNPVVWFTNKLDFRYLKNWDPTFSESEFTRGARQAVCTITELLSNNMLDSLKPLLTKTALLNLLKDVEILWADEIRRNISLAPSDIQLVIPRKVHLRNVSDKKLCDVDVVFIALKWLDSRDINPKQQLILVDIIARFHRNYTEGMQTDWTISGFKVRRFKAVPQKR